MMIMDLIQPMQAEYSRSKCLLYCLAMPIGVCIFIAAIVGAATVPEAITSILAIGTFVAQIVRFALRDLASRHQGRAEDIRRLAMAQDGLGVQPSPLTLARLRESVGSLDTNEPAYTPPYYDSPESPGPHRLLDITAESAFFTSANARWLSCKLVFLAGIGVLAVVVALVVTVSFVSSATVLQTAAKIVLASMAFWAVGDVMTMALAFWSLSTACNRILERYDAELNRADAGDPATRDRALLLFCEYNCAVVKAPPIPSWVYRRRRSLLNDAWWRRHPTQTAAPTEV